MPNPKLGTMTKDVGKAIQDAKAGSIQFKNDKFGIIRAGIGKVSFTNEQLLNNIRSFMTAVADQKPEQFKSKYILSVTLSSTMGPGLDIEKSSVDPSSPKFMIDPSIISAKK